MSLLSSLYAFSISSVEAMLTSGTAAMVSDALDLGASKLGDGATDLYFVVNCTDIGNAAVGTTFTVSLTQCDTSGGSYTVAGSVVIPRPTVAGEVVRFKLPNNLQRYVKSSITPGANMTGGSTFRAFLATS